MIIDLRKQSLDNLPIGTAIITSKEFVFKLIERKDKKEYWLDETSNLIWHPKEDGNFNYDEAMKLKTEQKRLPTKEEFEDAEKHGIREVLKDMDGFWFWSSTAHPEYSRYAYVFSGYYGGVGFAYRGVRVAYGSARCVSSPGVLI